MAQYHSTTIDIHYGTNTEGYFSFEAPDDLLLFVHGFGGRALGTWNNFPTYLFADNHFAKCDIVFYGYDTFKGQAGDHAASLYDFICQVQKPLQAGILPANQQLPERSYKRIILVAHSLGAVLVRQAQLLAHIAGNSWAQHSVLALFAPAHHGAKVISLAMESLPGLTSLLGVFAKFKYPILNDLDSQEDGILNSIKSQTEQLQNQGIGDFTKAKLVVYAMGDKVVRSFPYLNDVPPKVIQDQSHISVCKPKDTYIQPLELLRSII